MAGHVVEEVPPELHAPHFRDILLRGVAGIGVAGGAEIERDVELDAALGDVRQSWGAVFAAADAAWISSAAKRKGAKLTSNETGTAAVPGATARHN